MKGFFVTGTDTEIGKTYVSCLLLKHLQKSGYRVAGLKPIASGCIESDEGLQNEDALALQSNSNVQLPYSLVNRYRFAPAIAPHIAASHDNICIDPSRILEDAQSAANQVDRLIIEGAGGWYVPLGADPSGHRFDIADLAVFLGLPVIFVVGIKLGCINHARLTEAGILASKLPIAGWVANHCAPETAVTAEIITTLKYELNSPLIAEVALNQDALESNVNLSL